MKVAFHLADEGGCTYYRLLLPLSTARAHGALDARSVHRADDVGLAAEIVNAADVVALARISDKQFPKILDFYHQQGKRVVMDWDDDIFHVSPLSNFYEELGTENVTVEIEGRKLEVWKDGVNIDLAGNKRRLDTIREVCSKVDMLTVTTEILAQTFRPFNDNVRVLPNCVDLKLWEKLPLRKRDGGLRMGWFGGSSHYEDWVVLAPVLPEVMARYPTLKLVLMGQKFDGTLKGINPAQIEFHPWVHTQAYPYKARTLDLDFAVIPLKDTLFNWGKSPIKFIEMAAMGVPSVVSNVSPYAEVMDLVPDNGIFVENGPDAWATGIAMMIENAALRETLGRLAHQTVQEHFDIEMNYPLWVNAYKEVLACPRNRTQLSLR